MKYLFKKISLFTTISILLGLGLFIYSIIVQKLDIFFFWESSWVCFAVLLIGILSLLFDWKTIRKNKKLKTLWIKIGIGIIFFILIMKAIFSIIIPFSDAYKVAKISIKEDRKITNEIGEIESFSFIPSGGIQVSKDSKGEYGSATIYFILKGEEKYKKVTVLLEKTSDNDWVVNQIF